MELPGNKQVEKQNWEKVKQYILQTIGQKPKGLNEVLFLIGIQELGSGKRQFTKEEKQDIMHIASCKLLSYGGYYTLLGYDEDNWPHWELIKKLPIMTTKDQEALLQYYAIEYFKKEMGLHI